jgi:hypothetical protein
MSAAEIAADSHARLCETRLNDLAVAGIIVSRGVGSQADNGTEVGRFCAARRRPGAARRVEMAGLVRPTCFGNRGVR